MNVEAVAVVWAASAVAMLAAWLLQRRTRNAGIVDAVWAACMSGAALFYAGAGEGGVVARFAVAVLGGFWGFRLCMHVLARVLTEHEDGRYRHLRRHWRDDQLKFFFFFQFQAVLVAMFSLPFLAAAGNPDAYVTPPDVYVDANTGQSATIVPFVFVDSRNSPNRKSNGRGYAKIWRWMRELPPLKYSVPVT